MNRFSNIIIIGVTGTGKSLLASQYIASHPEARLVDSLKLCKASLSDISSFYSSENISDLAQCDTLVIDEVPASSFLDALSRIVAYRLRSEKNIVILSQGIANVERLFASLKCISSNDGVLLYLTKDTDIDLLCTCLGIMQIIRSDRPLELNLWKRDSLGNTFVLEQNLKVSLPPKQWNELVKNDSFWQLIEQSHLQSRALNCDDENMENGAVEWLAAANFLNKFLQDEQLPQLLRDSFAKVLSWGGSKSMVNYQLGLNFISSIQPA